MSGGPCTTMNSDALQCVAAPGEGGRVEQLFGQDQMATTPKSSSSPRQACNRCRAEAPTAVPVFPALSPAPLLDCAPAPPRTAGAGAISLRAGVPALFSAGAMSDSSAGMSWHSKILLQPHSSQQGMDDAPLLLLSPLVPPPPRPCSSVSSVVFALLMSEVANGFRACTDAPPRAPFAFFAFVSGAFSLAASFFFEALSFFRPCANWKPSASAAPEVPRLALSALRAPPLVPLTDAVL
mmetsp:Transcript_10624/g.23577  ORF Transcript_10624/g.23577 Transcript_10624/m.23577 type:complete len:238 (+) Transcript_10624:84-797(+)